MKYNKMNDITTANTIGLLKRLSKLIALQSIVLGATIISPPKDVKCVHKHWVPSIAVFGPTFIVIKVIGSIKKYLFVSTALCS